MKKLVTITLASVLVASAAYGQGTVLFKNYYGSVANDPAVWNSAHTAKITGTQYIAGLQSGSASGSLTEVAGATAPFFTQAAAAGFFQDGTVSLANVAGGATAFLKVEIWDTTLNGTTTGATFAQAQAYALANGLANEWGLSAQFSIPTGNPNGVPPTPANQFNTGVDPMLGFNMAAVPEPSTFALAGLGAAALMIFRRRKQ